MAVHLQQVPDLKEIILIGFYQPNEELSRFIAMTQQEFKISVRYNKGKHILTTSSSFHMR